MKAPVLVHCRDGRVTLQQEQARVMREQGKLDGERTWMRCEEVRDWLIAATEIAVCDFCGASAAYGAWDFPASDYRMPLVGESVGDWRACAPCARLVRDGKRDKLAARAAKRSDTGLSRRFFRDVHDRFWSHRAGPGRAVQ